MSKEPQKKFTQVELEMMVDEMKVGLPAVLLQQPIHAQILYRKFTELQKAGFNEEQALEIVKTRSIIE